MILICLITRNLFNEYINIFIWNQQRIDAKINTANEIYSVKKAHCNFEEWCFQSKNFPELLLVDVVQNRTLHYF